MKIDISDHFCVIWRKSSKKNCPKQIFSFLVRKIEKGASSNLQSPGGAVCNLSGIFYVL